MNLRKFFSLQRRIFFLVLLAILPALIVMSYSVIVQRRTSRTAVIDYAKSLAQSVSETHDHLINDIHKILFIMSRLPIVKQQNAAACNLVFAEIIKHSDEYTGLTAADSDGEVFAGYPVVQRPLNFSDREWFREVKKKGDFTISGKGTTIAAYPVLNDEGKIESILAVELNLAWLKDYIMKYELPEKANLVLFDQDGTIILRYPDEEGIEGKSGVNSPFVQKVLSQKEGVLEIPGLDDIPRLYSFTSFEKQGKEFFASVGIPTYVAFKEADIILASSLSFILLFLLVALFSTWFTGRNMILKPMQQLIHATEVLASGNYETRSSIPYTMGEIGQIAAAFDRMAESLQHHEEVEKEERKKRLVAEERFQQLFSQMTEGFALHEIICDASGKPIDYRFLEVNRAFEKLTRLKRSKVIGKTIRQVIPDVEPYWIERYGNVALSGKPMEFEDFAKKFNIYFHVVAFSPQKGTFATIFSDITQQKKNEDRIKQQLHWMTILNSLSNSIAQKNNLESVLRVAMH
ncbi:MAG: cache domain-containing protein, partial [Spirochaetota bacterium]